MNKEFNIYPPEETVLASYWKRIKLKRNRMKKNKKSVNIKDILDLDSGFCWRQV